MKTNNKYYALIDLTEQKIVFAGTRTECINKWVKDSKEINGGMALNYQISDIIYRLNDARISEDAFIKIIETTAKGGVNSSFIFTALTCVINFIVNVNGTEMYMSIEAEGLEYALLFKKF